MIEMRMVDFFILIFECIMVGFAIGWAVKDELWERKQRREK